MTSRSGGEHDSLFDLPFSGDLLASKVTQIDDAIQYEPLVRSSAWKSEIKNLCSAACETAYSWTNRHNDTPLMTLNLYWTYTDELGNALFLETRSQDDTSGTTRMIYVWSMNDGTTMTDDPWPLDLTIEMISIIIESLVIDISRLIRIMQCENEKNSIYYNIYFMTNWS